MGHLSFIVKLKKQRLIIGLILTSIIIVLVPFSSVASLASESDGAIHSDTSTLVDVNSPLATTIYVDQDATGGANNGTSWTDAYLDLQNALDSAGTGDQIWVAEGAYKPTGSTDRNATFQLKNGVEIYGGFTGTENNLNERDWQANPTILSGDIDGNDLNVPANNTSDIVGGNSYHIVTGSGTNKSAVLDGFTISGGKAIDPTNQTCVAQCGAGIYNVSGSPTLKNLSIIGNDASNVDGGGIYNATNSNPSLNNVTFTSNDAFRGGGMANVASSPSLNNVSFTSNMGFQGGGIYNVDGSSSTLTDVNFEANLSINNGSGMFNRFSQPLLINVIFLRNVADNNGGGIYSEFGENAVYPTMIGATFTGNRAAWGGGISTVNSDMVVINAVFSGNTAFSEVTDPEQGGGAIHNENSDPTLTNVTITGNESNEDGGGVHNTNSDPIVQNSIIWDNKAPDGPEVSNDVGSQPTIRYSDIKGSGGSGGSWDTNIGFDGGNNIDANPKFVRSPDPGADGEWDGVNDDYGDLRLQQGSPAINTGRTQLDPDPNDSPPDSMFDIPEDIAGNPRTVGGLIDMGAYAYEGKSNLYLPIIFAKP